MVKKGNVVVGLDIGTTKTCAIVGEVKGTGIDIIGIGSHPSGGLRKGVVVNIESTVDTIKKAVEEAEHVSGCEIASVYVGIGGGHIKGHNSLGIVAVKDREVSENDVERAIKESKAIAIPLDREILHTLPQYYVVDDQNGIRDPVGVSGVRLEAKVYIVTGSTIFKENVVKSVNRVGLDINDIVLEQLASSEAVLSPDEKQLGVALLDIGGGVTNIVVFTEGSIKHAAVLLVGGSYLTSDISVGLRTPLMEAEKIKMKYGCAYIPLIRKDETIEVPSVGGREAREVSRQVLGRIVEPRMKEILGMAYGEIVRSGCEDRLAAGVVLTGGGAIMEGTTELAEQVFNMPVRRGYPTGIGGLTDVVNSPRYATGVGLVIYGSMNVSRRGTFNKGEERLGNMVKKMKRWLWEFF